MIIFGLSLSTTDLWLLGISGTLIMTLIGYRFTISINRRNSFNIATKELIDTFHRELKEIYPIPANWPENIDHYLRLGSTTLVKPLESSKGIYQKEGKKALMRHGFDFIVALEEKLIKIANAITIICNFLELLLIMAKNINLTTPKLIMKI